MQISSLLHLIQRIRKLFCGSERESISHQLFDSVQFGLLWLSNKQNSIYMLLNDKINTDINWLQMFDEETR